MSPSKDGGKFAVVLAGAGARGAYEAGVLSVVLPELERQGIRPSIYVGTSAGSLNAVLFGALADLPAGEAAKVAAAQWRSIRRSQVFSSLLTTVPNVLVRYMASILGLSSLGPSSLLRTAPMDRFASTWPYWSQLHDNIDSGRLDAVAVVTTSLAKRSTVVFCELANGVPTPVADPGDTEFYSATQLGSANVLASSAIPVLFPPVRIDSPSTAAGWYMDGGVGQNNPIKPALKLGAKKLLVIGTTQPTVEPNPPSQAQPVAGVAESVIGSEPDIFEVSDSVLNYLLVNRLATDLASLEAMRLGCLSPPTSGTGRRSGTVTSGYQHVPNAYIAPEDPFAISGLAATVMKKEFGGLKTLIDPNFFIIERLLGGGSQVSWDLLSFLLFDPSFCSGLVEMGQQDGEKAIANGTLDQLLVPSPVK